ncbi:PREDICTED: mitochondria-eating protein [Sturnus vulgaris]|uniref:mitochondria-eating protein n=1 Tax=Sturnus vulgaris TaxID=9172 RepID=UPI00071AA4C4|nr:PREDICTED: mitochondria-eating protein [Sturnus vulgaris]
MAKDLRSLVGSGSARELQEKLESWHHDYEMNSSGENMSRCCEILELNNEIQKQLYSILHETSKEDECTETIKSYPLSPSLCSPPSRCENLTQDSTGCELQLRDLTCNPRRLRELEDKLTSTRIEINQMERDLKASRAGGCKNLKELHYPCDYDHQIQLLRDEMSVLDAQKSILQSRPCSPLPCCLRKPCALSMATWSPCQIRQACASRRACLIARFNFIYAKERLDAEALLRPYVCNMEVVQRIIYVAAVESFRVAKMAFWKVKVSVKETLALHPCEGVVSLEIAALDYIACHKDLYDVCPSIHEVICSMNMHPKLPCPAEVDFIVISSLIRDLCRLAFSMQTLIPPLDVAVGVDGELFNKTMYYRSFDSDFTAAFVAYHVWPALMENDAVIVKGEVVTKTIALCPRRCRIRSRSCSCGRRLLPGHVTRSRSLSTSRVKRR